MASSQPQGDALERLGTATGARVVEIEGRSLQLSHLEKPFYPEAGLTKGGVLAYYRDVAPALLPHLRDRAVTLKRYPQGAGGPFFYEKRCPAWRPGWLETARLSHTSAGDIDYCLLNDLPSLLWAANAGDLELHTSLARHQKPQRPLALVFDLDPGAPATIVHCCRVALRVRALFEPFGLELLAKTSGSKGLQLYLPLGGTATFAQTRAVAHSVAELLERRHPELAVSRVSKALRTGKVLVDWNQNDRHRTMVSVYSLRAKARPTISTPVTWDEVERTARSRSRKPLLAFEPRQVLERLDQHGDLFEPMLTLRQELPRLELD